IQTDKGELVIETKDDEVEVVVKERGKVVRIIDTKADKSVTLRLRSGEYELETKGGEGLTLGVGKMTLKRDDRGIAKIERVEEGKEQHAKDKEKVGEIRRLLGTPGGVWGVALSRDGRYALSTSRDDGSIRLWDLQSGMEIRSYSGHTSCTHAVAF